MLAATRRVQHLLSVPSAPPVKVVKTVTSAHTPTFVRPLHASTVCAADSTRRGGRAPKVLATPVRDWNSTPAIEVLVDVGHDADGAGQDAATIVDGTSTTVAIDLPPSMRAATTTAATPPLPWDWYASAERVSPTASGWHAPTHPAYDDTLWSEDEDQLIARVLHATPEGLARNWQRIAAAYFPHRAARALRLRWETKLKPQRAVRDARVKEVAAMRRRYGDALCVVGGRWAAVPVGRPTPQPYEEKLDVTTQPVDESAAVLQRVVASGDGKVVGELLGGGLDVEALLGQGNARSHDQSQSVHAPPRARQVRSHKASGLCSYDYALQAVHEAERARTYALSGQLAVKAELARRKRDGEVIMEEVVWLPEEDMALREGFEMFGTDWARLSRGLKARRRTADECRERMEELCQGVAGETTAGSAHA